MTIPEGAPLIDAAKLLRAGVDLYVVGDGISPNARALLGHPSDACEAIRCCRRSS